MANANIGPLMPSGQTIKFRVTKKQPQGQVTRHSDEDSINRHIALEINDVNIRVNIAMGVQNVTHPIGNVNNNNTILWFDQVDGAAELVQAVIEQEFEINATVFAGASDHFKSLLAESAILELDQVAFDLIHVYVHWLHTRAVPPLTTEPQHDIKLQNLLGLMYTGEKFRDRWFILAAQAKFMALYDSRPGHFPSLRTVGMVYKVFEQGNRFRKAMVDEWMNAEEALPLKHAAKTAGAEFVEDLAAALLARDQQLRLRLRLQTARVAHELRARAQSGNLPPAYRP